MEKSDLCDFICWCPKLLIYSNFHTQPSLEKDAIKQKTSSDPDGLQAVHLAGENTLLVRELRGE